MGLLQQQQSVAMPQGAPQSEMVDMKQAQASMAGTMDRLKRIVLAGQAVLYDEKTSDGFIKHLDPDNLPQSVGMVTAMVMAILIDKGREKAVPPDLVIPAGALVANDLLDYACKLFDMEMSEELSMQAVQAFAKAMQQGVAQSQQPHQQTQQAGVPQQPTQQPGATQ